MRPILNFMLRLLIDEHSSAPLHGAIQSAESGETYAFHNENELLEWLDQISETARQRKGELPLDASFLHPDK